MIFAVTPAVLAAGILYFIAGSQSSKAQQELESFEAYAIKEARDTNQASVPAGFVPMWPATLSAPNREHLEALRIQYHSVLYRRRLTKGFFSAGIILLLALGGFYGLVKKEEPNQTLEPTPAAGRGSS